MKTAVGTEEEPEDSYEVYRRAYLANMNSVLVCLLRAGMLRGRL